MQSEKNFDGTTQQTKINFLNSEVKQLNEKIMDLEEMLYLNKEALKSALNIKCEYPNSTEFRKSSDREGSLNGYKNVINNLQCEITLLNKNLEKVVKERNFCQSQVLLYQQISEASHRREMEVIQDYEKKIKNLYILVTEKERIIKDFERNKPIEVQEGVVIQNREILNPQEQVLIMHGQYEMQKDLLLKMTKEMLKLKEEKQELFAINFNLANEIKKRKSIQIINSSNRLNNVDNETVPTQNANINSAFLNCKKNVIILHNHLKVQKKFTEQSDSDGEEEYTENVEKMISIETNSKVRKNSGIPKLDLSKAKKIQFLNIKKIEKMNEQPTQSIEVSDKISKLENELLSCKKKLENEMCHNSILQKQLEILNKENSELKSNNESLINLHKNLEIKWEKINLLFSYYKSFYENYLDKLFHKKVCFGFLHFFSSHFPHLNLDDFYFQKDYLKIYEFLKDSNNIEQSNTAKISNIDSLNFQAYNFLRDENNQNTKEERKKFIDYLKSMHTGIQMIIETKQRKINFESNHDVPFKNIKKSLSFCIDSVPSQKKNFFQELMLFYNEDLISYPIFKRNYLEFVHSKENENNNEDPNLINDFNNFEDYNESKIMTESRLMKESRLIL